MRLARRGYRARAVLAEGEFGQCVLAQRLRALPPPAPQGEAARDGNANDTLGADRRAAARNNAAAASAGRFVAVKVIGKGALRSAERGPDDEASQHDVAPRKGCSL